MDFMGQIKSTLDDEKVLTENGAIGYKTTGSKLLDLNFKTSSLRQMNENTICNLFLDAYYEDKLAALKWLFYLRDIRGGQGERRSFRIIFKWLIDNNLDIAKELLTLIPEYGRWDDLLLFVNTNLKDNVINIVRTQLRNDLINMKDNKQVSLLSKWMPSIGASSKEKRLLASVFIKELGLTKSKYAKSLSQLRTYLKVVEKYISQNRWGDINYAEVPSMANLKYNKAFFRHDGYRRTEYLEALKNGETKINAGVIYPHDIVHRYNCGKYDETLEQLWKSLPNLVDGYSNTICVADGSGSMLSTIANTNVSALSVANALAIYFSEKCNGGFKNKYITFSSRPQLVDFSNANSLQEKITIAKRYNEVANTNIEAVFDLILNTAIDNNLKQNEIPKNILILSDMEFDSATNGHDYWRVDNFNSPSKTLFNEIKVKYENNGYQMPRIVFWNILSRSGAIPLKENDLGVALVSGFSVNTVKMIISEQLDPYKCLLEQLNTERYLPIEELTKDLI